MAKDMALAENTSILSAEGAAATDARRCERGRDERTG